MYIRIFSSIVTWMDIGSKSNGDALLTTIFEAISSARWISKWWTCRWTRKEYIRRALALKQQSATRFSIFLFYFYFFFPSVEFLLFPLSKLIAPSQRRNNKPKRRCVCYVYTPNAAGYIIYTLFFLLHRQWQWENSGIQVQTVQKIAKIYDRVIEKYLFLLNIWCLI